MYEVLEAELCRISIVVGPLISFALSPHIQKGHENAVVSAKSDRVIIRGGVLALIMETTAIKIRYAPSTDDYRCYYYITESSGRSYGARIFAAAPSITQAIEHATEESAIHNIKIIPYICPERGYNY
jgi:hypothetical protein